MVLLVFFGLCKKIKISFLEVGHTHEDVDGLIGYVVVKLRSANITDLNVLEQVVKGAIRDEEGSIKHIETFLGIPDYDTLVQNSLPQNIEGLKKSKVLRISLDENGASYILYKTCATAPGRFPKPIEP